MVSSEGEVEASAPRLLVVAPDVIGPRMAGPGLRYLAVARAMARSMPVTLAVGVTGSTLPSVPEPLLTVRSYSNREELEQLVDGCDVVFCQFIDTNVVRHALRLKKRVIYDLYNVLPVETIGSDIVSGFSDMPSKDREFRELLKYFRFCAVTGSYFVSSNARQRDYWLGFIMASGALVPSNFGSRSAEEIIGLLPFGMDDDEPVQSERSLRNLPAISENDFVILWAGGIWDWFDPETPIRAIAELRKATDDIKLVFYGTVHPNPIIGRPKAVGRAQNLAAELGVLGTHVIFLDDWAPSSSRANYLLDADAALSAHHDSLETYYAFRTRVLDHFWASLPSIVSRGDWFAEYIDDNRLGIVTEPGSVASTVEAVVALRDRARAGEVRDAIRQVRPDWRWSKTTSDLRAALAQWDDLPLIAEPEAHPETELRPEASIHARATTQTTVRRAVGFAKRTASRAKKRLAP